MATGLAARAASTPRRDNSDFDMGALPRSEMLRAIYRWDWRLASAGHGRHLQSSQSRPLHWLRTEEVKAELQVPAALLWLVWMCF